MQLGSTTISKAYLGGSEVRKINRGAETIHTGPPPFFAGTPPAGVGGEGFVPLSAPTGLNAYALGYSDVINPSLIPITASVASFTNGRQLTLGSFQPIQFRYRFTPVGGSANAVALTESAATKFDSWREGMLDGGEVRVWRVINGVMTLVRTSTITKHRASGWNNLSGTNRIVPAGTTSFTYNFQNYNRPNATQWFSVRSISATGNQSAAATAATHVTPDPWPSTPASPSNTTSSKTLTGVTDGGIAAPTGVVVTPSNGDMTVTVSWDAVSEVDGYIVLMSDYDPTLHAGHGLDLASHATPILAGDMVFAYKTFREIDRATTLANRVWTVFLEYFQFRHPISIASLADVWGEEGDVTYTLEDHDLGTNIPGKGQTYARITVPMGEAAVIRKFNHHNTLQVNDFYAVLDPDKTYRVECWMKSDANRTATFDPAVFPSEAITWNVTTSWQLFTHEFSPDALYTTPGATLAMKLDLGQGVWDIDSLFVFEAGSPHLGATPEIVSRTSGLGALRFHEHIKTGQGTYGLDQLTNASGRISSTAAGFQTYHSLLQVAVDCGVNPWMQIEMHFTPEEWDGFIEWFAGTTGAWAAKRIANGRTAPWSDAFDTIYFEISNETWNNLFDPWTFPGMTDSATPTAYGTGEVYGLFQEYVISRFKSSSHWTPGLEGKFKFVLGGRAANAGFTGGASSRSPNSHFVTIAAYNGGWEAGAGVPVVGDPQSYRNTLMYVEQAAYYSLGILNDNANGLSTGTYEAGPGYLLSGLNGDTTDVFDDQSQERVMKSKSGGVGTIDVFLESMASGLAIQNYFTLSKGYRWTSHANDYRGGAAFPAWQFVELFNQHCSGLNMLGAVEAYGPKTDLPAVTNGPFLVYSSRDNASDVAFYVFRGGSKLCLWATSRKLPWSSLPIDNPLYVAGDNGVTTAHIRLPIDSATSVKRYRMTGNYNQHNFSQNAFLIFRSLNYDGGTIAFTPGTVGAGDIAAQVTGSLVTGATSGATGQIWQVAGTIASGTLRLYNVQGAFQDNENLQVASVTYAVANGTTGSLQSAMILDVTDPLYANLDITEETLVVSDVQDFTIPGGIPPATADLYVFEGVTNASIPGAPSVSQVAITPTTGNVPETLSFACNASAYPLDSFLYEIRRDNVVVATQASGTYAAGQPGVYTVRPIVVSGAQTVTFDETKMLALFNGDIAGGRAVIAEPAPIGGVSVSGGEITEAGGYRIHTFTSSGTFVVSGGTKNGVDIMCLGSGSGGNGGENNVNYGHGGASGTLRTLTAQSIAAGTYAVTVPAGGAGSGQAASSAGSAASFVGLLSAAGGLAVPNTGRAGGGNADFAAVTHSTGFEGAGGAGAGAAASGRQGGGGVANDYSGTNVIYGGGGSAPDGSAAVLSGGSGGGGSSGGSFGQTPPATAGQANRGAGGGGGSALADGAAGGSGIVIVRYPVS